MPLSRSVGIAIPGSRTLLESVLSDPPETEPGTEYVYSNAGFAIAGAVVFLLGAAFLFFSDRGSDAAALLTVAAGALGSSAMVQRGRDQALVGDAHEAVVEGREELAEAADAVRAVDVAGDEARDRAEAEIAAASREEKAALADELLGGDS